MNSVDDKNNSVRKLLEIHAIVTDKIEPSNIYTGVKMDFPLANNRKNYSSRCAMLYKNNRCLIYVVLGSLIALLVIAVTMALTINPVQQGNASPQDAFMDSTTPVYLGNYSTQDDICTTSTKTLDVLRNQSKGSLIYFNKEEAYELFTNLITGLKCNKSDTSLKYMEARYADNRDYVHMTFDQMSNYVIEKLQKDAESSCCQFSKLGHSAIEIACNNDCFNKTAHENCTVLYDQLYAKPGTLVPLSKLIDANLEACSKLNSMCTN